jgi:hypothetical protein
MGETSIERLEINAFKLGAQPPQETASAQFRASLKLTRYG